MSEPREPIHEPEGGLDQTGFLARAAQGGDLARFELLYQRVAPSLYAWASLRVPRDIDSGDLLGDVWLRAVQSLRNHDAVNQEFRAWIFGIAKNVLYEALRQRARSRAHGVRPAIGAGSSLSAGHGIEALPESVTSISRALARDESVQRFLEYCGRLDADDRGLLVHCALEGFTCVEAATRLGITSEAATKRWQRLRQQLREAGWVQELLLPDV